MELYYSSHKKGFVIFHLHFQKSLKTIFLKRKLIFLALEALRGNVVSHLNLFFSLRVPSHTRWCFLNIWAPNQPSSSLYLVDGGFCNSVSVLLCILQLQRETRLIDKGKKECILGVILDKKNERRVH